MPELLKDLVLLTFGQYVGVTMVVEFIIAILLAIWVYKKWRSAIPGSMPLAIAFGIWVFAGQLMAQDLLGHYTVQLKSSPDHLEKTLHSWFSNANYPSQHLDPLPSDSFRIRATGEAIYTLFQRKDVDGMVTMLSAFNLNKSLAERLGKLSVQERVRLFRPMELGLLQIGVQHILTNEFQLQLQEDFPMDGTTTQADFFSHLFRLKRARALAELHTQLFFE